MLHQLNYVNPIYWTVEKIKIPEVVALQQLRGGRGRRLRTLFLRFWRPPLYQLSYSPIFIFSPQTSIEVVDRQGLEPRTDRL